MFQFNFHSPVLTDWLQAGAAIAMTIAAWTALYSWKHKRKYELKVEALTYKHDVKLYILNLLSTHYYEFMLFGEAKEKYENLKTQSEIPAKIYLEKLVIQCRQESNERIRDIMRTIAQKLTIELKSDPLTIYFTSLTLLEQTFTGNAYLYSRYREQLHKNPELFKFEDDLKYCESLLNGEENKKTMKLLES